LQVSGAWIVILDIRDDIRAARQLAAEAEQASSVTEIRGGGFVIGGVLGQQAAQSAAKVDTFERFTRARLMGSLRRRMVGVGLIFAGAVAQLAAGIIDTL
jgi:hypothetical protein